MASDGPRVEADHQTNRPVPDPDASEARQSLADPADATDAVVRSAGSTAPAEGAIDVDQRVALDTVAVVADVRERSPRSAAPVRALGYVLAGIVGIVLTVAVLSGTGAIGAAVAEPTPIPTAIPTHAATFALDGSALGVATAPVTVEIWADYQCPYCGVMAHGIEPGLVREMAVPGTARIDYRDFAFLGQESTDAAVAARCAEREGAFWRYHDLLFASQSGENQGAFARDRLLRLATFAGISDTSAFTTCLDDPAVAQAVAAETQEGRSYGIGSTPTIRIIGPGPTQLLEGVSDPTTIAAAVERASTPTPTPAPSGAPDPSASAGPKSIPTPSSR